VSFVILQNLRVKDLSELFGSERPSGCGKGIRNHRATSPAIAPRGITETEIAIEAVGLARASVGNQLDHTRS
jgi:hypothetical protein